MNETRGISFMSWITCEFVYAMHLSFVSHSLVWHGVSHSLVWHDSFMCLARDIHAVWYTLHIEVICDTHIYMRLPTSIFTLCDTHFYMRLPTSIFTHSSRPIRTCMTPHSYMYDSSFIHISVPLIAILPCIFKTSSTQSHDVIWLIYIFSMSQWFMWNVCETSVKRIFWLRFSTIHWYTSQGCTEWYMSECFRV